MKVLTQRKSHHPAQELFRTKDVSVERIRCALFDLDGTLVPIIPSAVLGRAAVRQALLLDPDKRSSFRIAYGELLSQWDGTPCFGDFATGRLVPSASRSTQVVEDQGVLFKLACIRAGMEGTEGDRMLHAARMGLMQAGQTISCDSNRRLFALMGRLRAAEKFLVTNSPEITAEETLKLLGIYEAFHEIYGSCRKPQGLEMLLSQIIERKHIEPKDMLYVGDNYGIEILIARRMGLSTVYLSRRASEEMLREFAGDKTEPPLIIAPDIGVFSRYATR